MSAPGSGPWMAASVAPDNYLSCSGCVRTIGSWHSLAVAEAARLAGWELLDDGWWCVVCQWRKGRVPNFARHTRELITNAAGAGVARPGHVSSPPPSGLI